MHKLPAVEEAKTLMSEAKDWSVWNWLTQKGRVRAAADRATEALAECEKRVKAGWDADLKQAFREQHSKGSKNGNAGNHPSPAGIDPAIRLAAKRIQEADDAAEAARLDAEETFDEAERRLSASMAREGAQKAIDSWILREKAIRKAEEAARKFRSAAV
jgi:hypothetical protein